MTIPTKVFAQLWEFNWTDNIPKGKYEDPNKSICGAVPLHEYLCVHDSGLLQQEARPFRRAALIINSLRKKSAIVAKSLDWATI